MAVRWRGINCKNAVNGLCIFVFAGLTCYYLRPTHSAYVIQITDHDDGQRVDHTRHFVSTCEPWRLSRVRYLSRLDATRISIAPSGNSECPRALQLVSPAYPSTGLVAFPAFGTAWLRRLLQEMTGFATGSTFVDKSLGADDFPYEGREDNVLVVHTTRVKIHQFSRLIVILGNPYDVIVSEFKRNHNLTELVPAINQDPGWDRAITKHVRLLQTLIHDAFSFKGPLFVVFYEHLRSEIFYQLVRLATFLENPEATQFSFCCALRGHENYSLGPTGNSAENNDLFRKNDKVVINKILVEISDYLKSDHPEASIKFLSFIVPT